MCFESQNHSSSTSLQFPQRGCEVSVTVDSEEEEEIVDELLEILIDCLGEVNTKSRRILIRKFLYEVEKISSSEFLKKIPPGGIDSGGRGVSFDSTSSHNFNPTAVELSQAKLERFKIRTPVLDGVVAQDEPKGNSETTPS